MGSPSSEHRIVCCHRKIKLDLRKIRGAKLLWLAAALRKVEENGNWWWNNISVFASHHIDWSWQGG
jgi:hypothetical protein